MGGFVDAEGKQQGHEGDEDGGYGGMAEQWALRLELLSYRRAIGI
jgi:hypothetical protein